MKPKALAGPHHSVGPGPYGSLPPKVALGLRASVEFGALIRVVLVSGRALSVCRPLPGSCGRDATVREVRGSFERFSSIAGALEAGTRERLARCHITDDGPATVGAPPPIATRTVVDRPVGPARTLAREATAPPQARIPILAGCGPRGCEVASRQ